MKSSNVCRKNLTSWHTLNRHFISLSSLSCETLKIQKKTICSRGSDVAAKCTWNRHYQIQMQTCSTAILRLFHLITCPTTVLSSAVMAHCATIKHSLCYQTCLRSIFFLKHVYCLLWSPVVALITYCVKTFKKRVFFVLASCPTLFACSLSERQAVCEFIFP